MSKSTAQKARNYVFGVIARQGEADVHSILDQVVDERFDVIAVKRAARWLVQNGEIEKRPQRRSDGGRPIPYRLTDGARHRREEREDAAW